MSERIYDKIQSIEENLQQILEIVPHTFEEYKSKTILRAACERYFEKVMEDIIDLVFIFIKEKKIKIPEDDEAALKILAKNKIISEELSKRLIDAKGMRNFIIHQYEKIDDLKVYTAIKEELGDDVKSFIKSISENLT